MHKIADIAISMSAGYSENNYATSEFSVSSLNLTGLTDNNGYFYYEVKHINWSDLTFVKLMLSPVNAFDVNSGFCETYTYSLDIYPVNSSEWTAFRLPLNNFVQYGPSFDVSSSYHFSLQHCFTSSGQNIALRNLIFEYGNEVNSLMQFTLVASGGGDAVRLEPNWDYKNSKTKIEDEHRLDNGDLYVYRTGDYSEIEMTLDFFPNSSASVVNSLWLNNTPCYYYEANSHTATRTNVMIRNKNKPFFEFQEYYVDLMTGEIKLESI